MSTDRQILLIGLPSTGKTSFLAALWYMVDQTTVDSSLVLDRLDGDSTYLNEIRQSWLEYRAVSRTFSDSEKLVSMRLKDRANGAPVKLIFPDLSGESFRLQWTARQFTTSYDALLRQAAGAILFVHPASVVKPNRIDMVDDLLGDQENVGTETAELAGTSGAESFGKPWEGEKAPTQVQLIELLQFMVAQDYFRPPFKLCIVVSAWDLLGGLGISPKEWVSTQLPMLRQFFESNEQLFAPSFYGLSAQGAPYPSWRLGLGDIKNEKAFAKRLVENADGMSTWLWGQFDESIQKGLRSRMTQESDSTELQGKLVSRLNTILSTSVIFEADRFKGVQLRGETEELRTASGGQRGDDLVRLNRLLLEDAYPAEISRDLQLDAAMRELQNKTPAMRISVVGPNNEISHDITEPVRWLMN